MFTSTCGLQPLIVKLARGPHQEKPPPSSPCLTENHWLNQSTFNLSGSKSKDEKHVGFKDIEHTLKTC